MRITAARSGLTKFHYDFLDDREQPLGTLDFPTGLAVSEGSSVPAALQGRVRFVLPQGEAELHFTRTGREWSFTLKREGQPIATAFAAGRHRLSVKEGAREFQLEKRFSLLRLRFEVLAGGRSLGFIFEPDLFTVARRRFLLQLPLDVSDEARALLFFVLINSVFR
jgi:hypothetical protein